MNVAIVNNHAPFVRGGAELLAETLRDKILQHGANAEVVRIPFQWAPVEVIADHIVATRLLRLENADHVIALKFPAYYVRHRSKTVWLLHQFRQAYDLYGTAFGEIPATPEGEAIRSMVHRADDVYLREAREIYTNSAVTGARLRRFNGLESNVLHPPLWNTDGYRSSGYGDYILCIGRISDGKRQRLAVAAMPFTTTGVRLVVAGPAEDTAVADDMRSLVAKSRCDDRVELEFGWQSDERKKELLAGALAVAYLPYDEDSYGFVTLEAFESCKPVVTCSDSGGTRQIVIDRRTGRVVDPEPAALASAFDELARRPRIAQELGEAGRDLVHSLDISWDHVLSRLLP